MKAVELYVQGVGLVGPGLPGWAAAQPQLAGLQPHQPAASVVPAPMRLPPAERRRAGTAIKIAIAVADAACSASGLDAAELATVFTSSSGDGGNCHALCEMLASGDRLVSPTRFTNSVHNAAAGYWHIAVGSRAPSTSLCAFDGSWGAGLIEAAALVAASGRPVLLVASDAPYPEPLQ
ncbi:MAG TPA: beta-ketoacyl synthase chain length factor, partial [Burkholderiaceae bacterium]|nr:beta-ketoacyl synthase chain length factor [Burkholderiaceae bacterium]